jgi:hypothetical protein
VNWYCGAWTCVSIIPGQQSSAALILNCAAESTSLSASDTYGGKRAREERVERRTISRPPRPWSATHLLGRTRKPGDHPLFNDATAVLHVLEDAG